VRRPTMRPYRPTRSELPTRSNQHWCNLCNAPCESDEALREHYRQCHPEAAALLEQFAQHDPPAVKADHPAEGLSRSARPPRRW
jgi:hypothetical protein